MKIQAKKRNSFYDKTVNRDKFMTLNDKGSVAIEYDEGYPLDAQLNFFMKSISEKSSDLSNFELSVNVIKIL